LHLNLQETIKLSLPGVRFRGASSNRVQENLTQGGLVARSATGRRQRTRAIQGIDQNVKVNRALWLLAEGMKQLKR